MLTVHIPAAELWNETTNEFMYTSECTLQMEHSLVSISKWESKWHKPFLSKEDKTPEEMQDYIRCMLITQNVPEKTIRDLPPSALKQIKDYINDPMTATWFREDDKPGGRGKVVTSEVIYYWMIAAQIPFECQKWHLNRLLTLIKLCNVENAPKKKMSQKDVYARNKAINDANRKRFNTKG